MKINEIKNALAVKASSVTIKTVPQKLQEEEIRPQNVTNVSENKTDTRNVSPIQPVKNEVEELIAENLRPGIDYNTIPGCGKKPVLLKAGAEHLASLFGFSSTSSIIHRVEDYKNLFVLYEVETMVFDSAGNIKATGIGSCNSKERKYQRTDFAGNLNTILKMAKKRSYVDAILTATHSSGTFTQDMEDIALGDNNNSRMESVG